MGSGPGPQHRREGPAPEAGTSTQRMLRGLAVLRGRRRMSGLLVLPLYHQHHHPRTLVDRRFLSFSSLSSVDRRSLAESRHHHGREKSEAPYVSRREIQLSPVVPQTTEKRTITVIPSPPRPLPLANSAGVMGPADSAALADSAGVRGLTGSAEPDDSLDYESAEALGTMVDDEPEVVCNSAAVADQAQDDDPAVADSAHSQKPAGDDLARGDRSADQDTPTGTTPVTGQDTSMGSDASSLTFPSLPRTISQATLVDFISMWTLMQHRMDTGKTLTDTQSRPVADTPPTRPVQTPPGRAGTPVRRSRTPDKQPWTPVRRARGKDESRDSTRLHSPIRRSSSSESCNRDASPVDFSAAQLGWAAGWFCDIRQERLVKFVSLYPDARAEWTDAMSVPWDNGRGLLYAFPPFKMVPQVLQKIAQSPGTRVILIAPLQPAASWFPELIDLSQEDPIPLFVQVHDLLTQDVMDDGLTETRHYRLSNIQAWKLWGPRAIPGKWRTWC